MLRFVLVIIGVFGLVAVRAFENQLFYDPFLAYFKGAGEKALFPDFEWTKLIISHLFRFVLNCFFSLWIIQFLFNNRQWTKIAFVLMIIIFIIVFPIYLYCIHEKFKVGYLFSFYIRRFVIQPLTLIILVPIFYYIQKKPKV